MTNKISSHRIINNKFMIRRQRECLCCKVQSIQRKGREGISDVARKRIVRTGNVTERGSQVEDSYGNYSEPVLEPCVKSAA
ncbi:MAG: hypothetical protein J6A08_03060 [Lachnospiraceae bacterium]|nr:hypothetical protein [Lachnospiraceae bacterium]